MQGDSCTRVATQPGLRRSAKKQEQARQMSGLKMTLLYPSPTIDSWSTLESCCAVFGLQSGSLHRAVCHTVRTERWTDAALCSVWHYHYTMDAGRADALIALYYVVGCYLSVTCCPSRAANSGTGQLSACKHACMHEGCGASRVKLSCLGSLCILSSRQI